MYVGRKPGADFKPKYLICRKPNGMWEILFRGKRTQGTGLSAFYRDAKQRLRSRLQDQQRIGIAV